MLGEVKAYSQRKLPQVDLETFVSSCNELIQCESLVGESALAQKVAGMLPSFQDEGMAFEETPENMTKFQEVVKSLVEWFRKHVPDFQALALDASKQIQQGTPKFAEDAKLSDYAKSFPPTVLELPDSFGATFNLQCASSDPDFCKFLRGKAWYDFGLIIFNIH